MYVNLTGSVGLSVPCWGILCLTCQTCILLCMRSGQVGWTLPGLHTPSHPSLVSSPALRRGYPKTTCRLPRHGTWHENNLLSHAHTPEEEGPMYPNPRGRKRRFPYERKEDSILTHYSHTPHTRRNRMALSKSHHHHTHFQKALRVGSWATVDI